MTTLRNINTAWIIHIFAVLHAVAAIGLRVFGLEDELLLTILTMTMALMICLKKGVSVEFSAASIIVVNILGYLIGNLGAKIIQEIITVQYLVHSISTFLTTEILGWSLVAITKVFQTRKKDREKMMDSSYISWLILAMGGIFILRLGIIFIFRMDIFADANAAEISAKVFSNSFSFIILICINFLFIRYAKNLTTLNTVWRSLMLITFIITISALEALFAGIVLDFESRGHLKSEFPILFASSLLVEITIYCIVYMVNYALTARSEMKEEREKANMAQYRYIKLKHQVSPHFLFNSLNTLDGLICDEQTDRASSFTHKLAGVYRYMLKSEDEMIVPLKDELVFVKMYVDLLKERFPVGFVVETDVPDEALARYVLPCSVQLLIENATKHNAVSEENPLVISVKAEGENIVVSNNMVPKVTKVPSTGLGQKYIRQMYLDLTGKQIRIERNEKIYRVTLPLI